MLFLALLAAAVPVQQERAMGPQLLPLFRPQEVVLFQGDSITDGNRGRSADPNHILGHGYAFSIASRFGAAFPGLHLTFLNRGISGNTVADLDARWEVDTLQLKPTVLSILVGINDINYAIGGKKEFDAAAWEARYDQLLARTVQALPTVRLILCEPFTLDTGNHEIYPVRRRAVEAADAAVARLALKYHAADVKLRESFDAVSGSDAGHWIWDGIHPTYSGHGILAEAWLKAYQEFFVSPLEDPARNSAISPTVNIERDSYDWLHRHRDILDAQKTGNPDLVLIGDSITHFWGTNQPVGPSGSHSNGPKSWQAAFGKLKVINMGCGWDRTQNVLWRMEHGEFEGMSPKAVVLNIGTNNLVGDETARLNSPDEVAVGIGRIVEEVQRRSPTTRVFVMGVFPRGYEKGNPLDGRIRVLNGLLAEQFAAKEGVTFLDIGEKMRNADGSMIRGMFSDGTHPTEEGYRVWAAALKAAGALPQ